MKPPRKTPENLHELQEWMAAAVMRPLVRSRYIQKTWFDGKPTTQAAAKVIKPNARQKSWERLQLYNQQYWFRIRSCFEEDFPGLKSILGDKKFAALAEAYLRDCPSRSFTLRNLGQFLAGYLKKHPELMGPKSKLALDMVRLEWAQTEAFDSAKLPPVSATDLAGADPNKLRLGLQPHVQLLDLDYPLDHYAIKLGEHERMRTEAGKVFDTLARRARLRKVPLPKKEKIYLVVHRADNRLFYKRISRAGFAILKAIQKGRTLSQACAAADKLLRQETNDPAKTLHDWFSLWASLEWFTPAVH
ncbi:MAG TPA: DNA-binding domain-containing protein [Phycisphaerae bacterium]|nr:DNA-binding domain-containing protein [Phycisphaerae bacterium]